MKYHVKRVPFPFFLFFVWVLLILCVKAMCIKRSPYIIQMDKSQMPIMFTTHHNWYLSIINSLKSSNSALLNNHQAHPYILYNYDNVIHGFCAALTLDELKAVEKSSGFISAHIDTIVTIQTTHTYNFLSLNASNGPWKASHYGKDVVIAILDSGVWPESPSFNDKGMSTKFPSRWKGSCNGGKTFNSSTCNFKIIGARYFNEGIKAKMTLKGIHVKDSARDDIGHGTQVASIAAGNYVNEVSYFGYGKGTAVGVAPQARLAIYKVVGQKGGVLSDIFAGFDQAIIDNVDVINLSLGFSIDPSYEGFLATATFSAMEKGIVVVGAAGNYGPHLQTLENDTPWIITVTASIVDRWFAGSLVLGNAMTILGWSMFVGDGPLHNLPLVYDKHLSSCDTQNPREHFPYGIIMCIHGNVRRQIDFISRSNALGAILIHDHPIIEEFKDPFCPCIVINQEQAKVVMSYVESNTSLTINMNFKQTFTSIKPTPIVNLDASRGPSLTYSSVLKPDIMAPGSLVLAAWPPTIPIAKTRSGEDLYSSYNIGTGTSMATPHVTGVVALLKSTHPKWSPAAIKSAIMTTANTLDNTLNPIQDFNFKLASPLVMGAGQINPTQALDPGLVYNATPQDFTDHLCSITSEDHVFSITKHYCINQSFDLNYPSFMSSCFSSENTLIVHKFKRTVTNVGEGATTYKATVVSPYGTTIEVSPKTLVFQKKYEQRSYNLTITCKEDMVGRISYGELLWVDTTKKYRVRSPIVVMPPYI